MSHSAPSRCSPAGGCSLRAHRSLGLLLPGLVVALLLSVVACSSMVKSPEIRIARVDVTDVGLTGATARVGLRVANPNGFGLTARSVRYRLEFDEAPEASEDRAWLSVARGETVEELRVEAEDSALVTVDIPFRYQEVGRAVGRLLREGSLSYRLSGDVRVDGPLGDLTVPFDDTGRVTL